MFQSQINRNIRAVFNTYNGRTITQAQSQTKRSQINQVNRSNSDCIQRYGIPQIPNKFDTDLASLQRTCIIQRKLIDLVKKLQKEKSQCQQIFNIQINQINKQLLTERNRLYKQTKEYRNQIQALKSSLSNAEHIQSQLTRLKKIETQLNKNHIQYKDSIRNLKRQFKQQQNKSNYMEIKLRQIQGKQRRVGKTLERQGKAAGNNNEVKGCQIRTLNSQHLIEQARNVTTTILTNLAGQNYVARIKDLQKQNEGLVSWIRGLLQYIQRIVCFRLKQLKETNQMEKYNYYYNRYLPKMHLYVNTRLYYKDEFPFHQIMQDFQRVTMEAQKNKMQKQRYMMENKVEIVSRARVLEIVGALSNVRSVILEEYQKAGQKKNELKRIYQQAFPSVGSQYDQIVSDLTVLDIMQFQKNTEKIMSYIQQELLGTKKQAQKLKTVPLTSQPQYIKQRRKIQQQINQAHNHRRDLEARNKQTQQFIKEKKQRNQQERSLARKEQGFQIQEGLSQKQKMYKQVKQRYQEKRQWLFKQLQRTKIHNQQRLCSQIMTYANTEIQSDRKAQQLRLTNQYINQLSNRDNPNPKSDNIQPNSEPTQYQI